MSSPDMHAVVTCASRHVLVAYPRRLSNWFDGLGLQVRDDAPEGWVKLEEDDKPDQFRLTSSARRDVAGLSLPEALVAFWEQVTFLLIDRLADSLALHAAAMRRGNGVILVPGSSGAGKTQLALWYRTQDFALATDELVALWTADDGAKTLWTSPLARPLFVKRAPHSDPTPPIAGLRTQYTYADGQIVLVEDLEIRPAQSIVTGLIVFPRYRASSRLELTALTPAQAALRLMKHCVNVRNLPNGGLTLAADVARRLPAISICYGETRQLHGTLDVLTRQVLASSPSSSDLAALCDGLTARSSPRLSISNTSRPTVSDSDSMFQQGSARRLTIGMATYDEYDGVFFTIQSIRLYHPELAGKIEFLVIDNNPDGPCSEALKQLAGWIEGYRYIPIGDRRGTAVRDVIFEQASCEIVLCMDPHVLIVPGALMRLIDYCQATPNSRDLLQGPLLYDDLRSIATHFEPRWRDGMYGTWGFDTRGADPSSPAFDIPMQGLGLFVCRRDAWPGFNEAFRGFGGEEGYIHEKIRRLGGRTLCLPFLRWVHRFSRPLGTPYANRWEDRIRNYFIGLTELGLDTAEMEAHFGEVLGAESAGRIFSEIRSSVVVAQRRYEAPRSPEATGVELDPSSDGIYSPHNLSFGDQWASINFYLNMSVSTRRKIKVASVFHGVNLYRLHNEIVNALDSPGKLELTLSEPTVGIDGYNVWSSPYFPTKQRWNEYVRHRYVCMQFDGVSAPDATNPSAQEEMAIREFLRESCLGIELITLGKWFSVEECVEIASNSIFFVGVDSGMSHLCHSVGVPVFLLEYGLPTVTTHAGKAHILCRGFEDFKIRFIRYVKYLHAVGSPDAQNIVITDHAERQSHHKASAAASVMSAEEEKKDKCALQELPNCELGEEAQSLKEAPIWIRRILSLLSPSAVVGMSKVRMSKVRIGGSNDGGYVLIDDLKNVKLCYSFGIGSDVSWDLDMARRGATVFQYDHTVSVAPERHPAFRFHPVGIACADGAGRKTLETILNENGHIDETDMILKMDVEGAEWDIFDQVSTSTLNCFRQIVCEFHGLSRLADPHWRARFQAALFKIAETHASVHVHGNNYGSFPMIAGIPVPDVLEVTYARRSTYTFETCGELFPTKLDQPNCPELNDMSLGRFQF